MRKLLAIMLTFLYYIGLSSGVVSDIRQTQIVGTPAESGYTSKALKAKVPWDMIISDGKLYAGGGDYNENTGPVEIRCMDLKTGEWTISGTLPDEAIGKFVRIGETVYAPGFDAKGSDSNGNYYRLENGQWTKDGIIPGAAHVYDIAEYDNQFLFAIGTWTGTKSPVQASADQGNTFVDVPFYKDDVNIIEEYSFDFTRVYDFFINDQGLYCIFLSITNGVAECYEFYKYQDGAFHFVATEEDNGIQITAIKQEPISAEVTFEGQSYIATRQLSRTTDFQTVENITLPYDEIALDLLVEDDKLYVLCAEKLETSCIIRIYEYVYNSMLLPLAAFESENLPMSFVKNNDQFYVGIGWPGYNEDAVGNIITITP